MSAFWPTIVRVRRPGDRPDVILRALRVRDRVEWERVRAANAEWLLRWEASSPEPVRAVRFSQLVRSYEREARAGRSQPFVIECEGRIVGQMQLSQIVWGSARTAKAGYWVAQESAGDGIAPTALAALADHAFLGLGLHRVVAQIQPDNVASLRVVEKLGFRQEGLERGALWVEGAWRDHLSYALTREDLAGDSLVRRWNAADAQARGIAPTPGA